MIRKIVAAIILASIAIVIIAFAVANRQDVTVSFDPFSSNVPAGSVTQPLFVVLIAVLILGVVIGGIAAWFGHGKWRRTARRLERELDGLRSELHAFRRAGAAASVSIPRAGPPPERLKLTPPPS